MKLLSEINKDARQLMREKRTPVLLLVGPLLVLFIMGAIFSGDATLVGKSAMGVCDLDRSNSSQFFLSGIGNSSEIIDYSNRTDCAEPMEKDVRGGKLSAGLVIPAGFGAGIERGNTQTITMLLDNSKFQVSPSIEALVKANVQETDRRIGTQFILSVWDQLGEADAKLGGILADINETRGRALQMKVDLKKTADSLNALNISAVRDEVQLANITVEQTRLALDRAEQNLTRIESDFASYDETLRQTEADLLQVNGTLANASLFIRDAKTGIDCGAAQFAAYCQSVDTLNATVESAHQSVELRITRVRKAQQGLQAANATIQEFKANIAAAKLGANESEKSIGNMQTFVEELEANRATSLQTLREVDRSVDDLVSKTYDLEGIVSDSRSQIRAITARAPDFIISPMVVESNHLFGKRPFFEFMLPSIMPLILMFVSLFLASTSLVKEKHDGTLARVYISQVNRFKYAAVKIISYSLMVMPCALLLALVASVVYHSFPVDDWNAWFYVLQTLGLLVFSFVAIGMLIAIYASSEATAFLSSLVIGLPLLFLSGILFPFEFMPPLIATAGLFSPLTQAVISMQATLLYNSPQFIGSSVLLLYAIFFTMLAGLSLKK